MNTVWYPSLCGFFRTGNESSTVTVSQRSARPHHSRIWYFPSSFASAFTKQLRTAAGYSAMPAMAPTNQQSPSAPWHTSSGSMPRNSFMPPFACFATLSSRARTHLMSSVLAAGRPSAASPWNSPSTQCQHPKHLHRQHSTLDRNEPPTRATYTPKHGSRYVVMERKTSTTGEHRHALARVRESGRRRTGSARCRSTC